MQYFDQNYCGNDTLWIHPLFKFKYTDSIGDFCHQHKAYWILDVVGSYTPELRKYPFTVIYFDIEEGKCHFYAKEDSDKPNVVEQHIDYTDLDVSVKLFFTDGVLMFPSDY